MSKGIHLKICFVEMCCSQEFHRCRVWQRGNSIAIYVSEHGSTPSYTKRKFLLPYTITIYVGFKLQDGIFAVHMYYNCRIPELSLNRNDWQMIIYNPTSNSWENALVVVYGSPLVQSSFLLNDSAYTGNQNVLFAWSIIQGKMSSVLST